MLRCADERMKEQAHEKTERCEPGNEKQDHYTDKAKVHLKFRMTTPSSFFLAKHM